MKRHTHLSAAFKAARSRAIAPLVLSLSLLACSATFSFNLWPANPPSASPLPRAANASPAELPVVYVSDFELDILHARPGRTPPPRNSSGTTSGTRTKVPPTSPPTAPGNPPASSPDKPAPPPVAARPEPKEDPAVQEANELVTAMAENLVTAIEKAGYTVQRLHAGAGTPQGGFAHPRRLRGARRTEPNPPSARRQRLQLTQNPSLCGREQSGSAGTAALRTRQSAEQ